MEHQKTKRREWVKTAAIIFLAILLVLTFFSNTIMNHSLPEVAAQYAYSGTINAKIRGTGTISANETYDVTLSQTRKIRSVLVRVGQEVAAGDVLFTLEAMESDELKQAQDVLGEMELSYQKSLIEASNTTSTENRDVQKLRDNYNEALATYRLYSNSDPSQITMALEQAKVTLSQLERASEDAQQAVSEAMDDRDYQDAQALVSELEGQVAALEGELAGLEAELETLLNSDDISIVEETRVLEDLRSQLAAAERILDRDQMIHGSNYDRLSRAADGDLTTMAAYAERTEMLREALVLAGEDPSEEELTAMSEAYMTLTADQIAIDELVKSIENKEEDIERILRDNDKTLEQHELSNQIEDTKRDLRQANRDLENAEYDVSNWEEHIDDLEDSAKIAARAVSDQQALINQYTQASSAAEALKAAEEALEDKIFTTNLGDSGSLDLQNAKKAIEEQKLLVEKLSANADGQEITANVSGVVSEIHVTAGNTAGADMPIATITVADRGYTVQIPVTNEQARQVRIGDMAEITNFWYGNLTATLENIGNDPQSMGKGKILIFRLTGDGAEAGMNLTLSIGQKSANYDTLVPNSAVRTDANGSFVLVVVAKSSPLGNRYVATRADVQVLASDDTTSAVSGLANGDFVITTSTVPIEAGSQVRLVDNG